MEDELLGLEAEIHGVSEEATSTSQETNEPPPKKHKGPVSKLLGDLFKEQQQTESDVHVQFVDSVLKELEMYKAEKPADPEKWWYRQKSLYPLMCRLVQKFFSFVATSIPSERLFSSAGNIITEKRNCLTPQHADQLVFLYENTK